MRHISLEYIDGLGKEIYKDFIFNKYNESEDLVLDGITVVIPIGGIERQRSLEFVLARLQLQKTDNLEIIVSELDFQEKIDLHKFTHDKRIRKIFTKTEDTLFNKSVAVNVGTMQAKYNKIIMNDADILVPNNYISEISNLLDKYDAVFLGKEIYNIDILRSSVVYAGWSRKDYFSGGNIAYNKHIYEQIGGMCELFRGYGSEDCEFMLRLKCATNFYESRNKYFLHIVHKRPEAYSTNTEIYENIIKMSMKDRINFMQTDYQKRKAIG